MTTKITDETMEATEENIYANDDRDDGDYDFYGDCDNYGNYNYNYYGDFDEYGNSNDDYYNFDNCCYCEFCYMEFDKFRNCYCTDELIYYNKIKDCYSFFFSFLSILLNNIFNFLNRFIIYRIFIRRPYFNFCNSHTIISIISI